MLKFIENERYFGDKLSMRVTKNSKKLLMIMVISLLKKRDTRSKKHEKIIKK